MPYVNIRITSERVTPELKAILIAGVTRLLAEVLGRNPQTTTIIIDEVDPDNWGIGGETVSVRRRRGQYQAGESVCRHQNMPLSSTPARTRPDGFSMR